MHDGFHGGHTHEHEHEHMHTHEHTHEHTHDGIAHTHAHTHEHVHEHSHEAGEAHLHSHEHLHEQGTQHSHSHEEGVDMKESIALLDFMLHHNMHHTEELEELAGKLREIGKTEAAERISSAVTLYEQGNAELSEALMLINQ